VIFRGGVNIKKYQYLGVIGKPNGGSKLDELCFECGSEMIFAHQTTCGKLICNNCRDGSITIVQETDEMANWLHPQNEERKKRIRERMDGVKERFKEMRDRLDGTTL
jgi:hypothetical protein